MSVKLMLELICDECGETIIKSVSLQTLIDEIPKHRKVCKPIRHCEVVEE
jgi:hypothetical protein